MSTRRIAVPFLVGLPMLGVLCNTSAVMAETQRDLDSHEHGAAALNVVIDGNSLFIEFESPWMNLVGFEHQPSTEDQLNLMSAALDSLADPDRLFTTDADADCNTASADVSSTVDASIGDADSRSTHGEKEDRSDEARSEEAHTDEAHADDDRPEGAHSEVIASYVFECSQPESLENLSVSLFEIWPGIDDVDVQMAGPGGQSTVELDPAQPAVNLSGVR